MKFSRLVLTLILTASLLSLPGGTGRKVAAQTSSPPPLFMNASGLAASAFCATHFAAATAAIGTAAAFRTGRAMT